MLKIGRVLSQEGEDPYSNVYWEAAEIDVKNDMGERIFYLKTSAFPTEWSESARKTVAQKYFRASRTDNYQETSVKDMVERVVNYIKTEGISQGYFEDGENANIFADELTLILLNQMASFNSPVWFNVGVPGVDKPTASACFINEVRDDMSSILNLAKTEGLVFKEGSGSGVNFSALRGSREPIRGGGTASGPVSFMQGYDAFANVILSGGRTRRAARMCILDIDHPDIEQFINCKADEEDIVKLLALGGMTTNFTAPNSAYGVVKHQSGNNSVRLTDDFMSLVRQVLHGYDEDRNWDLVNRSDGKAAETVSVKHIFRSLAKAAHKCGDPGVQFHDTINLYNTCSNDGTIEASNPCSEFMWLNNSACNLASINLAQFSKEPKSFDTKLFKHVVRMLIIAQDILVTNSSYPTEEIENNSQAYRPLGLGYANIGGLLMSWGIPYDSAAGTNFAASITSLMTAQAYLTSVELAENLGAFPRYEHNVSPMEDVLQLHYDKTKRLSPDMVGINKQAKTTWQEVMGLGFGRKKTMDEGLGFRNSQVTLLAPTGTISFMMDCATTGIEPEMALVKYKSMVGGETIKIVNPTVKEALKNLGYAEKDQESIVAYAEKHGHLEGSGLKDKDLPVFDCSFRADGQKRQLAVDAHLNMVAAIQPFLSGAVSKTYNVPHDATVDQIERTFLRSWEMGLKCVTIYREGSKLSEPMRVREIQKKKKEGEQQTLYRRRLPDERDAVTHHFNVASHDGYVTIGKYADGSPGELFIRMAGHGSVVSGILDAFATSVSLNLQYGVPLRVLIDKFAIMNFAPNGVTQNRAIPFAKSIIHYIFTYMEKKFLGEEAAEIESNSIIPPPYTSPGNGNGEELARLDGEMCPNCGNIMRQAGTCSYCPNCAHSSGVCS